MTPEKVEELFTRSNGEFVFARWGRPIAPATFGAKSEALEHIKDAYRALGNLTGQTVAEEDPEAGRNCLYFFCANWNDLLESEELNKIVPNLSDLIGKLKEADANQYRLFRFDDDDGIKGVIVMLRMAKGQGTPGDGGSSLPPETFLVGQAVQTVLMWRDSAFNKRSAFERQEDRAVLRQDIGDLIRACYADDIPRLSRDPAIAQDISSHMNQLQ